MSLIRFRKDNIRSTICIGRLFFSEGIQSETDTAYQREIMYAWLLLVRVWLDLHKVKMQFKQIQERDCILFLYHDYKHIQIGRMIERVSSSREYN